MSLRARWLLASAVVVLAAFGHVYYHYFPRARAAAPGDSPVAALLADADFPAAVWVPYPHQNLARLRELAGTEPATLRALARLAGLPSPSLPGFGPLALPPSSEIAVASDETGERFVVFAQVYPAFAAFAKLAGRLANNPWLRGGEIVVDGRTAEVSWSGSTWRVISSQLSPEVVQRVPPAVDSGADAGGLAWIRIWQSVEPLPAGLYRLRQDDGGLLITSRQDGEPETALGSSLAAELGGEGLFLLIYTSGNPALDESARSLAFFDQQQDKQLELPRIASFHEPGSARWSLPGESLLELAGREPRATTEGTWAIAALDSTSLEEARGVTPALDGLRTGGLAWGLWFDLDGGLAEVRRIARLLGEVPIVPRRQVERWTDAELVLEPLAARYVGLEATVSETSNVFTLRLTARPRR